MLLQHRPLFSLIEMPEIIMRQILGSPGIDKAVARGRGASVKVRRLLQGNKCRQ